MEAMTHEMKIKLFDATLPLPKYQTAGAVGLDLYARVDTTIPAGGTNKVPLNVAIEFPPGYWGLFVARSSLQKKGLMMSNAVAIMDSDYCGDNDEYWAPLYNRTDMPVTIEKGERIVQLVLLPALQASILQVEKLAGADRGGFGTTGEK
jgi:dUTP pyrophosphatase